MSTLNFNRMTGLLLTGANVRSVPGHRYSSTRSTARAPAGVKPALNWANCKLALHTSDSSTNYTSFLKGPRKAPNRFKTKCRSVLTFEEKKQSVIHLFKTFFRASIRLHCVYFAEHTSYSSTSYTSFLNWLIMRCKLR